MFRWHFEPWKGTTLDHVMGVVAFTLVVLALLLSGDPGWTPLLDSANLAFHEAGHIAFRLFGSTASLYGGALGQLVFPFVTMAVFFWKREAPGVAVGGIWASQNLFNIARYMADARAGELPLVGGGEHDFLNIFSRWGVLRHDLTIASVTRGIGWLGILASLAWLLYRFREARREASR